MYNPLKCSNCGCLIAINEGTVVTDKWFCDACETKLVYAVVTTDETGLVLDMFLTMSRTKAEQKFKNYVESLDPTANTTIYLNDGYFVSNDGRSVTLDASVLQ